MHAPAALQPTCRMPSARSPAHPQPLPTDQAGRAVARAGTSTHACTHWYHPMAARMWQSAAAACCGRGANACMLSFKCMVLPKDADPLKSMGVWRNQHCTVSALGERCVAQSVAGKACTQGTGGQPVTDPSLQWPSHHPLASCAVMPVQQDLMTTPVHLTLSYDIRCLICVIIGGLERYVGTHAPCMHAAVCTVCAVLTVNMPNAHMCVCGLGWCGLGFR